jgi:hypothetical protein
VAVTHAPIGFTGTVDEVGWSKHMALAGGAKARVASSTDWAVAANVGATRTVTVAAGSGYAAGVSDSTTATDSLTFAANTGGSTRFDAVVARFVWGSDTATFNVIQGTTSPPALQTSGAVNAARINRLPGVQYDMLLAIVQVRVGVGAFSAGDVFDCRLWGGYGGELQATAELSGTIVSTLDVAPGAKVRFNSPYKRRLTYDGATWLPENTWRAMTVPNLGTGWTVVSGHTPRAVITDAGTVRLSGWLQNVVAFTPNFDAILAYVPATIPAPVVRQSFPVAFATPAAGYGMLEVSIMQAGDPNAGGLRCDIFINNTSPNPIPSSSTFFFDGIEYDVDYPG